MTTLTTKHNDEQVSVEIKKNKITIDERSFYISNGKDSLIITEGENSVIIDDVIQMGNGVIRVELMNYTLDIKVENPFDLALNTGVESGIIESPMAGIISNIPVKIGDTVNKGETVMVISAMKMENKIISPIDGWIKSIKVSTNDQVDANQLLAEIGENNE